MRKFNQHSRLFIPVLTCLMAALILFPAGGAKAGKKDPHHRSHHPADNQQRIVDLVALEKRTPTTPSNAVERYRTLLSILQTSHAARRTLPKDEALRLDSQVRKGQLKKAAPKIRPAILNLENVEERDGRRPVKRAKARKKVFREKKPDTPIWHVNIHHMALGKPLGNILKLNEAAIDPERDRLYISGTKTFNLGIIDLETDELIASSDMGIPGGFLLNDPLNGDLYLYEISLDRYFKITNKGKCQGAPIHSLPDHLSLPEHKKPFKYGESTFLSTGYPFKAGYLQDANAAYSLIEVRNESGKIIDRLRHGPDALRFSIDRKRGKLYGVNTGDGSITVFDLKNGRRKVKEIDVGTSVDEILLHPADGSIYIRNRLGGSTLFHYHPATGQFMTIPNENMHPEGGIGMWPTKMIAHENQLFVLSHYGGRIDVIDMKTNLKIRSIPLNLATKPRMDCLSTMVMNKKKGILYAAFPELGTIAAVRAKNAEHHASIPTFRSNTGGEGRIVLASDDVQDRLFAYVPDTGELSVYNGESLTLTNRIPLTINRMENALTFHPKAHALYAGNRIIDSDSLSERGRFEKGECVVGMDDLNGLVYLKSFKKIGKGMHQETIYEYRASSPESGPLRQWVLSPVHSIPSSIVVDDAGKRMYAGYFEAAVLEAFDIGNRGSQINE